MRQWKRLLRLEIDFDNYLNIAYFDEQQPTVLYRSSQSKHVYAEMDSRYVTSLYLLDPFYTAHLGKIPVGAYRLLDLAPDKFRTTSYYLEYYRKTTLIDEIAFFAYVTNGWTINICIGRDETSKKTFRKIDRENALKIAPTVAAFLERHFAISPIAPREVSSRIDAGLISRLEEIHGIKITPRQAQVAVLLLRGHSSKSIRARIGHKLANSSGIPKTTLRAMRDLIPGGGLRSPYSTGLRGIAESVVAGVPTQFA